VGAATAYMEYECCKHYFKERIDVKLGLFGCVQTIILGREGIII